MTERKKTTLTIAILAYNRAKLLPSLLESILRQTQLPNELLICEDKSPEREKIRSVIEQYKERFAKKNIYLNAVFNEVNLGYDRNLRNSLHISTSDFTMTMGNDDVLLPNAVKDICDFLDANSSEDIGFISGASKKMYMDGTEVPSFTLARYNDNRIFKKGTLSGGNLLIMSAIISGLVFSTPKAQAAETTKFDGGLYYQVYLALILSQSYAIGYCNSLLVRLRMDIPPDFGGADIETSNFTPGGYTAKARTTMVKSLLDIARSMHDPKIYKSVKSEINKKFSIHVIEMIAIQSRMELLKLVWGHLSIGCGGHPVFISIFLIGLLLGKSTGRFLDVLRRLSRTNFKVIFNH